MPVKAQSTTSRARRFRRCGLFTGVSSMLGLRNSFHGKRTPSTSTVPQAHPAPVEKSTSTPQAQSVPVEKGTSTPQAQSVPVKKSEQSNTSDTKMVSTIDRSSPLPHAKATKANTDAAKHNTLSSPAMLKSESDIESRTEFERYTVIEEITPKLRMKVQRQLSSATEHKFSECITIDIFLDYVAAERLRRMPKRGALWDKVLKWAEYFAGQVSIYQKSLDAFAPHSMESAQLVWASCRVLLQMGPSQASALERCFGVFYKLGLTLSFFLRNRSLFNINGVIRQELGHAYADLLRLVTDVTVYYRKQSNDMSAEIITIDFDKLFGRTVDGFYHHRDLIADAMWIHQLRQSTSLGDITVDIRTIRQWLAPQDRTLKLLSSDRMGIRGVRDEYTCEWFQTYLLDFIRSKDAVLAIDGKPGSGKSVLAGWIVERLQRPLARKSYNTITYMIDADIPTEATSLNLIKGLVLQLLEQSVGDVALYNSLVAVFEMSAKSKDASEVESALWRAFDTALKTSNNLVILVDGLDVIAGGEPAASKLLEKLHDVTSRHSSVKTIVLARSSSKPYPKHTRQFFINAAHIREDIHYLVHRSLSSYNHFRDQKEDDREAIVKHITESANGSFVWADLTLEILKKEKSHSGFMQALGKVPAPQPGTLLINETLQRLFSTLDLTKHDTQRIISWLLVAERPLTLTELKCLLEVDVSKGTHINRNTNVEEDIKHACESLVEIREGIVRFRHNTIRQYLIDLSSQNKHLIPLKDAQHDLTIRTLTYVKICLTRGSEPSFDGLEPHTVDEVFRTHRLLEYSSRYWTLHFRHTSMYRTDGKHAIVSDFKSAFPSSTMMALIEGSIWETQTTTIEAIDMHLLALTVRQLVFGETHKSVLQCEITIARLYEKLSYFVEASKHFFQASRLSQMVIGRNSILAITCATSYLTCTTSITITTRSETTIQREEILKYLIATQKHHHGRTDELTIKYTKMLAQLYIDIKETHLAAEKYREIYEASVERYGQSSSEVIGVSETLTTVLRGESKREDVVQYSRRIFETAEKTMDITNSRRITVTIQLAETYESQGEISKAEEVYITLWQKISELCKRTHSTYSHEKKIEIIIKYVQFLRRQKRTSEAESILRGMWAEYEHEEIKSETIIIRLKSVGEELRSIGVVEVALSIFTYVWTSFKRISKQHSEEAASTVVLLAETAQATQTHAHSSTYESLLKEVFESSTTMTSTAKVDITTVRTCETLSTYYTRRERWSDAAKVCQTLLSSLWQTLTTHQSSVVLPKEFTLEAIQIATRLAYCYFKEHEYEKAENVYLYIFRATKSTYRIQDDRVSNAFKELIGFYEKSNQHGKAITIYKEIIKDYRNTLGSTHILTIQTLYRLGDLCIRTNQKDADQYYMEIITSLNKDSDVCHKDAFEATTILSELYYKEKRWTEAHKIYAIIWRTFTRRGKEYGMSTGFVEITYDRYFHILEKEVKVEYSILRQTTIEYRETCIKVFGARSEITLKATLQLAHINERSSKHQQEAISIYEETFREMETSTTNTKLLSIITLGKKRLAHLYLTNTSSSASSTQTAIKLYNEQLEHTKVQHGCSHESTLIKLRELVTLYRKQNTEQLNVAATRELQGTMVEVITTEKDSKRLFEAGSSLATTYTSCGFIEQGWEVLRELRRQIINKDTRSSEKFGFRIESVDRRSYVFLVAFEETLKGNKKISFSEVMTDMLTETVLYEHFHTSVKHQKNLETILRTSARLRLFQISKQRKDQSILIEDETFEIFMKHMSSIIKTNRQVTRLFFNVLLDEFGKDQHDIHLGHSACIAGNEKVRSLIEANKFQEAYELAICVYQFVSHQHSYHHNDNIGSGFKLSLYMAGRGIKRCPDQKSYLQMMELSKTILREVFEACKHLKVDFVRMETLELNNLVGLMGEQQNFSDLEWLLTQLWNSRHAQATWSSSTIVGIGRRLVEVRFAHNHRDSAIHLCEDICYNLRRVWGPLDRTTLEMSSLLSQLYTAANRYRDAMGVHEELLRQEVSDENEEAATDNDAQIVVTHLELLKRAYQRQGGWDKDVQVYKDLFATLADTFKEEKSWSGVQGVEKWSPKLAAGDTTGTFVAPTSWEFMSMEEAEKKHNNLLKRRTEDWARLAIRGHENGHANRGVHGAMNGGANGGISARG